MRISDVRSSWQPGISDPKLTLIPLSYQSYTYKSEEIFKMYQLWIKKTDLTLQI